MATTITFNDIQNYLNAIADKSGIIAGSPHKRFWNIPYNDFVTGNVPHATCDDGSSVPILNNHKVNPLLDPLQSPFYRVLINSTGVCGNPQMPEGGPLITDSGYTVSLPNGTTISGSQIQTNIESWLSNGFPEI